MRSFKTCLMGAVLSLSAASSFAAVIYAQDFSNGLRANETITGDWSIQNGKLSRGVYNNDETDTFKATFSLAGYKDIQLSYDYDINTERCCDGLRTYIGNADMGALTGIVSGTFRAAVDPSVTSIRLQFGSDWSIVGTGFSVDNIRITGTPVTPVPEAGIISMMGIGLMAMGALGRRRTRRTQGRA